MKHPKVKDLFSIDGQVALVTGGGRGIGEVFSVALAEAGADVAVMDIDLKAAQQTVDRIRALGKRGLALKADVSRSADVDAAVSEVVEKLGGIDILVNNAGICIHKKAEEMTDEEWLKVIDINLNGVFYCARAVGQVMIKQGRGGKIVNVASMSASIVNRPQCQVAYNASKSGVLMITKSLAVEWAQYGIRVNSISPGYTLTELVKQYSDMIATWEPMVPMKRLQEPEELRGALIFLVSDASSYVTGHDLISDGGYVLI